MKILIVLPNWLGDALMATPAIELLAQKYSDAEFTFVGSYVSVEALKHHPKCHRHYIDETKKGGNRFVNTYRFAKLLGKHDLAVSFRNQLHSTLLLKFTNTTVLTARSSWHARVFLNNAIQLPRSTHLVKQYCRLVAKDAKIGDLKLYIPKHNYSEKTLGINPGATYGLAKRWYSDKFADVATAFANEYKIIIFGGPNEVDVAKEIEDILLSRGINNYENLAGKTDIEQLCSFVGGLDLFVTNDSGPMHVAAAYKVKTVSIFGPTSYKETSQWGDFKNSIVTRDEKCAPCMKRECPLGHHDCMKKLEASLVIEAVNKLKTDS